MPYIPERRFEDKPDTYTPFVPLDPDNIVEDCTKHKKVNTKSLSSHSKTIRYLIVALFIFYILKHFKRL